MRDTGPAPCLAACGAAIAPTAAMTAAPRNSEQKIRRNRGGVNGETEFEFVIIELVIRIAVVAENRRSRFSSFYLWFLDRSRKPLLSKCLAAVKSECFWATHRRSQPETSAVVICQCWQPRMLSKLPIR